MDDYDVLADVQEQVCHATNAYWDGDVMKSVIDALVAMILSAYQQGQHDASS